MHRFSHLLQNTMQSDDLPWCAVAKGDDSCSICTDLAAPCGLTPALWNSIRHATYKSTSKHSQIIWRTKVDNFSFPWTPTRLIPLLTTTAPTITMIISSSLTSLEELAKSRGLSLSCCLEITTIPCELGPQWTRRQEVWTIAGFGHELQCVFVFVVINRTSK